MQTLTFSLSIFTVPVVMNSLLFYGIALTWALGTIRRPTHLSKRISLIFIIYLNASLPFHGQDNAMENSRSWCLIDLVVYNTYLYSPLQHKQLPWRNVAYVAKIIYVLQKLNFGILRVPFPPSAAVTNTFVLSMFFHVSR